MLPGNVDRSLRFTSMNLYTKLVFLRWLYSKDLYEESLGKQNYVFPRDRSLSRISSTKNDRVT